MKLFSNHHKLSRSQSFRDQLSHVINWQARDIPSSCFGSLSKALNVNRLSPPVGIDYPQQLSPIVGPEQFATDEYQFTNSIPILTYHPLLLLIIK